MIKGVYTLANTATRILRVSLERRQKALRLWKRGVAWLRGEAKSDQYEWRHLREEPLRSLVMFNTVPGSRVGRVGVAYQRVLLPQESSSVPRTQASRVSEKEGRRLFSPPLILEHPSPPLVRVRFAWRQKKLAARGQETVSLSKLTRKTMQRWFSPLDFNRRWLREWDREGGREVTIVDRIYSPSRPRTEVSLVSVSWDPCCVDLEERGSINF